MGNISSNSKGMYKGKSHAEGGIPVVVDGNTNVEIEGNEYHLCRDAMSSAKIYSFKNKSNKEILDSIYSSEGCKFVQGIANSGDFIVCKLVVLDDDKRTITGTVKSIIDTMQSEKSCNVSEGSNNMEKGGYVAISQFNRNINNELKNYIDEDEEVSFEYKRERVKLVYAKKFYEKNNITPLAEPDLEISSFLTQWVSYNDSNYQISFHYNFEIGSIKLEKVKATLYSEDWDEIKTFADGGNIPNSNIENFMNWYKDWYKDIADKMNILISLPSVIAPFKEDNVVILDLFEKIDQNIDAKPYLKDIVDKADEYDVTIYLEPMPRYKFFLKNIEKRIKISKHYLISYYEKFDFKLTPNKIFMKRLPINKMEKGGGIPNNIDVVNGFYSPLEKIISETKFDKLPAKQWIEKFANGDEAKWTGLKDWLLQQQGSISKADIQNFLKENRIEVIEVTKSDYSSDVQNIFDELSRKNNYRDFDDWDVKDQDLWMSKRGEPNNTKFSQYQLEGEKENYKEVLVTMPTERSKIAQRRSELASLDRERPLTESEQEEYDDLQKRWRKDEGVFKSSHFDETNILVHLRMNTRTDAEGNKVLFLEEIQSDWGQKGKKEGFAEKLEPITKDNSTIEKIVDKESDFAYKLNYKGKDLAFVFKDEQNLFKNDTEINNILLHRANRDYARSQEDKTPTAPFVIDTNAWTKLGLKVALKEAVKQGADKIAWTTGEQQNERYDLSKQVDDVSAFKKEDGTYEITARKGSQRTFTDKSVPENKLEGIVGKELAKKIIEDLKTTKFGKTYEGNDLKIGGTGMKGFYGSPTDGTLGIVGNVAKSLFKQEPKTTEIIKGDKVEYDQVDNGSWSVRTKEYTKYFTSQKEAKEFAFSFGKNKSTQYSIDITPELKESTEEGLPMFKKGGSVDEHKETYERWKSLVNMSKSELKEFYDSQEGKDAGLSDKESNDLGISNGRESARWIMRMKDTPVSDWTPKMWEWANKQISFISRMSGNKGSLYDDNGNKTRKHTSLLIWGHNPKKMKQGGNVITYRNKFNKKYGFELNESHSLEEIAKLTSLKLSALQDIYNKGIGAYKTNPESVRPIVKSKEQWAMARVYSAVMGGKASKVDANELERGKMADGGEIDNLFELVTYQVTIDTNSTSDEEYSGFDEEKAISVFNGLGANDLPTGSINYGGFCSLYKKVDKYKFVYELDKEYNEEISDYPIEEYYDDKKYYKLVEEGEYDIIEHRDIAGANDESNNLLDEITNYYHDEYGKFKYNLINVYGDNDIEQDEPIGCIQLRIADHTENINNVDRFGRCDFYISVVVADNDVTRNRFGMSNSFDRRSNEVEILVKSRDTFDDAIDRIQEEIINAIEYVKLNSDDNTMKNGGELAKGIKTEMEHKSTIDKFKRKGISDKEVAKSIAQDHLKEDSSYYSKLAKMEGKMEQGGNIPHSNMELLAPNGNKSNLNHEQWHLVRTPQFKAWFGDWEKLEMAKIKDSAMDEVTLANISKDVSKVVDENGEPLVVYHYSKNEFNKFKTKGKIEVIGGVDKNGEIIPKLVDNYGAYFTANLISREFYFDKKGNWEYECFLKMINPYYTDNHRWSMLIDDKKLSFLKENNYDGVMSTQIVIEYVVLHSNQIKLADGSNTTFDGNNDDIRYEDGGSIEYKDGGSIEVVMDEGSGIVINKLFNEWNNIKNQKQHDKWVENVKGTKFGTYGTIGLLELLDKFNFKNSTKVNIIVKNNFIKEVKSALTNYAEGGEVSSTKTIEPNSSDEFDEIIMANIDPHDDWIGNLVKERDIKQQIYKQLNGDEQEKEAETNRIFYLYLENNKKNIETPEMNNKNTDDWINKVPLSEKYSKKVKSTAFRLEPTDKNLLKIVEPFASKDQLRQEMGAILFDDSGVTCTDGTILIHIEAKNLQHEGLFYGDKSQKLFANENPKLNVASYPKWKNIIRENVKDENLYEIDVLAIKTYCEIVERLKLSSAVSKTIKFSFGNNNENIIGFNYEFMITVCESLLLLGYEKCKMVVGRNNQYALFIMNENFNLSMNPLGQSFALMMPVMVANLEDYGNYDIDFDRGAEFVYSLTNDAIYSNKKYFHKIDTNITKAEASNSSSLDVKEVAKMKSKLKSRSTLPILDYCKIENEVLTITDLDNIYQTKATGYEDGLYEILGESLNKVGTPISEYPILPANVNVKIAEINRQELVHILDLADNFVGNDEYRLTMTGVSFISEEGKMIISSTDSHKLFRYELSSFHSNKDFNVILPVAYFDFLRFFDCDNITVYANENLNRIMFDCDSRNIYFKNIDGRYPKIDSVIPLETNNKIVLSKKLLSEMTSIKTPKDKEYQIEHWFYGDGTIKTYSVYRTANKYADKKSGDKTLVAQYKVDSIRLSDNMFAVNKSHIFLTMPLNTIFAEGETPNLITFSNDIMKSMSNLDQSIYEINFSASNKAGVVPINVYNLVGIPKTPSQKIKDKEAKKVEPIMKQAPKEQSIQERTASFEKTAENFADIRQSLDEFFTPEWIAEIMFKLAIRNGFNGGKIIEPSFGHGVFFDVAKKYNVSEKDMFGFEIYKPNFDFVKAKYPNAHLFDHNFEYQFIDKDIFYKKNKIEKSQAFQQNNFDLVIGNPPYGKHKSPHAYYFDNNLQIRIEGFFIYLGLQKLKKGGLLIYIINSLWLQNADMYNKQKEEIAKIGDLIDAYRLPNKVFKDTGIATDIVIFRKK